MTWPRLGARRLIGAGLLLPGLLLSHPLGSAAQAQGEKALPKRAAPKEQPPKTPSTKKSPANVQPTRTQTTKTPVGKKGKSATSTARPSPDGQCVHVVRAGDSVARVAAQYRVGRQSILTSNHLASASMLKVGQRLAVPGCNPRDVQGASPGTAVELEDGLLLARVGPARVPTRLFVAVPEFGAVAIEFAWPVDGPLASGFGKRRTGWHAGIDIQAEMGTPVLAAAAGTVSFSGWAASYGRLVKVQHPNGFVTIYAHNSENLVQVGDTVETGTAIATVGRSGRASAHHLHFEIRREGMAFNPLYLLESRDHTSVFVSAPAEPFDLAEPIDDDPDDDGRE